MPLAGQRTSPELRISGSRTAVVTIAQHLAAIGTQPIATLGLPSMSVSESPSTHVPADSNQNSARDTTILQVPAMTPHAHGAAPGTATTPWGRQCSFAQLVDPNEGTELKFVPSSIINGVKCTQLEQSDVKDEIQYWQSAVLCTVMGANPPFEVMKGFLKRIWANYAIDRILYARKGVFLVRFVQLQDKISVEKRVVYFFDSKPMLVKGWHPNIDLQT